MTNDDEMLLDMGDVWMMLFRSYARRQRRRRFRISETKKDRDNG
jgi:hypothetical protein